MSCEAMSPAAWIQSGQGDALICLSHLRWNFVFQRPQHLMTRFAALMPVVFFEEPIPSDDPLPEVSVQQDESGVYVVTPRLPHTMAEPAEREEALRQLLRDCMTRLGIKAPVLWFYTPMMLPLAAGIEASAMVYDCMDELSNFKFAPPLLRDREEALLDTVDLVFTGGASLFEAKRGRHRDVHLFPSSVDAAHFGSARTIAADAAGAADQAALRGPRLGFFGVIDERMDLALIRDLAAQRPDWSIVLVGPVVKIDPADLPVAANIHYLGARAYGELPACLAGWDVALMPFALNESTRFISPTKTPEYLAGGVPVVSTAIADVVRQYGDLDTVAIAGSAQAFIEACDRFIDAAGTIDFTATDRLLAGQSWDATFAAMARLLGQAVRRNARRARTVGLAARPGRPPYDALVVGAGFAGAVMAERLARDGGQRVLVIDKRTHIGGNAYDHLDDAGLLVHAYGPHIFHTNAPEIVRYLSRFTAWRPYEHRVRAQVDGGLVPIPINRETLNTVFGLSLASDAEAEAFLATQASPRDEIRTSEDVVLSAVGRHLYEMFFRGYTRKQWGLDPSELDRSVTARIPTRTSLDDRYFTDSFQAMPANGYTAMFGAMLDHPNITVELDTDYRTVRTDIAAPLTVYTGPIDGYFDHCFGALPYRSLRFEHETLGQASYQPVGTVNVPDERVPYTRITEFKHLTGQQHPLTSIVREYPTAVGEPYYPIPRPENAALYQRYARLAAAEPGVIFTGRLASYRYYNMDQVVGQALAAYRRMKERGRLDPTGDAGLVAAQ